MSYKLFIIPRDTGYVQFASQIRTWERIENIHPDVPTVALIDGSDNFVVIYKGKLQHRGGSGSCFNPTRPTFKGDDPMDNSKIEAHMSKWVDFSTKTLLQEVIAVKVSLLKRMGIELPICYYWDYELYHSIPAILIAQLDAIGMKKVSPSVLKERENILHLSNPLY